MAIGPFADVADARRLCRSSILAWARYCQPAYKSLAHLKLLDRHLMALLGDKPTDQFLLVSMPPRHGKPVDERSFVMMDTGGFKPLGEIVTGDEVRNYLGGTSLVTEVHEQPGCDSVALGTFLGRELIAGTTHPILTNCGWKEAGQVQVWDKLALMKPHQRWIEWADYVVAVRAFGPCDCRCLSTRIITPEITSEFESHVHGTFIANDIVVHNTDMVVRYGLTNYFLRNPSHHLHYITYSEDAAADISWEAKEIARNHGAEIFGHDIDKRHKSDTRWRLAGFSGSFNALGAMGGLTGKKCHVIVIDDPVKNAEEALSHRQQEKLWQWWQGTVCQRIQSNEELRTRVIVIHTRWTNHDLIGKLIQEEQGGGPRRWRKLVMPAIAERDEYYDEKLFRAKGDPLSPEIADLDFLEKVRNGTSNYWWMSTWQQRPVPQEDRMWEPDLFDDEVWVDSWPSEPLMYLVVAIDPALGRSMQKGDYSAIVSLGLSSNGRLFVQADMERSSPVETNRRMMEVVRRLPQPPDSIAVEAVAWQLLQGISMRDDFLAAGLEYEIDAVDFQLDKNRPNDKIMRIQELDPFIRQKDFRFIRGRGTQLLVSQLMNFPSSDHDDGPDALELATYRMGQFSTPAIHLL